MDEEGRSPGQLLGIASATVLAATAGPALPAGTSYLGELLTGNTVHALSAVLLLAGGLLPIVAGLLFLVKRRGALVGGTASVTGIGFVVLATFVLVRATATCDVPGGRTATCIEHPWWLGSEFAAAAYLGGGLGMAVAGVLALRA